ncbi:YbbR-like domain-containing protein [Thermosulfurimonas sp. F29]|uniref:CdaR family protein n=1 Tax=Thermosulfurimonas sp. F29 TaxID=2867247 RepID=UPI001C8402A6|nr:CdaR family protein [Thermosulfurimonas sp. F29]MBX6422886.1 hypothetical protein [Thermosulfurimonas sp. F29]
MRKWKKKHENLLLKFLALFFASLLWFFVALQEKVSQEIPIRIVYRNVPPGTVLVQSEPALVRVKVVGPRSLLRFLPDHPLVVSLNLAHLSPGRHRIRLSNKIIHLPSGLKVQEINPPRVEVFLDRVVERWVRVTPELKGRPEEGYLVTAVQIRPPSVKVRGARQILRRIETISTLPVDVSHKKESFETEVFLEVPDGVIDIKPNRVWIKVVVRRESP